MLVTPDNGDRPATVMESAAVVLTDTTTLLYIGVAALAVGLFVTLSKK